MKNLSKMILELVKEKTMRIIGLLLTAIGAINWGILGICGCNITELILGSLLARIIYIIIGASGVFQIWCVFKLRR